MKKALLISDSHNQNEEMMAAVEYFSEVDAIFHMGDIGNAKRLLESRARCLTYVVRGNTDHDYDLPEFVLIEFAGKRVLATHGHRYVDYGGVDSLRYYGEENQADVVLFGHIHRPVLIDTGTMLICNPGSTSRPRQRDRCTTCAVLSVEDDGTMSIEHYDIYEESAGSYAIEPYTISQEYY
ncbi:MAG: YfcE family phosphodiesterase [Eubacterium sp.]|nr:YfcE family phosphodiesterase [Eubacterium sp.]